MSTALERVETPLLPMEPEAAKQAMAKFQALTKAMLQDEDWQTKDKFGQKLDKPFVKKSGFAKIATGYTLSAEILVEEVIERDEAGEPVRARAIVRVTHPSGRHWDGSGRCSTTERGFSKAEHDVTATAVTRATDRGISWLVGFGQVAAEEMDGEVTVQQLPYGPIASDEDMEKSAKAVASMREGLDGHNFVVKLAQRFDGVPEAVAIALRGLATYVREFDAIESSPETVATEAKEGE